MDNVELRREAVHRLHTQTDMLKERLKRPLHQQTARWGDNEVTWFEKVVSVVKKGTVFIMETAPLVLVDSHFSP